MYLKNGIYSPIYSTCTCTSRRECTIPSTVHVPQEGNAPSHLQYVYLRHSYLVTGVVPDTGGGCNMGWGQGVGGEGWEETEKGRRGREGGRREGGRREGEE